MVMSPEKRKAFGEKMAAARLAKKTQIVENLAVPESTSEPVLAPVEANPVPQIMEEESTNVLKAQIELLKANQELMMMLLKGNQGGQQSSASNFNISNAGKLQGEIEKYSIDTDRYPDPTIRLRTEPRLQPLAFDYNYELDYKVSIASYETKTGVNYKEPQFLVTLNRIVLDAEGNQTLKRYIVRRMIFHEDPQAAIVIARENGIDLKDYEDMDNTDTNQRLFLDEMRYLRVKDWLFGIFWQKPVQKASRIQEEVIGGQIVQVFMKNSENSSEIDFSKIGDSKLRS